jgi:hypothetical protein
MGLERGPSASCVQLRSYLEEKVAAPVQKSENTAVGFRHADQATVSANVGTNFADKRQSFGVLLRMSAVLTCDDSAPHGHSRPELRL